MASLFPKQMKVNKERVLNALKWLQKHHDGYHNIVITPENFWFDGEEIDMCKDTSVIKIKSASNPGKRRYPNVMIQTQ